jgi:hypothetical protein
MKTEFAVKSDDKAVEVRVFPIIGESVQNEEFTFMENVTITQELHY